MPSTEIFAHINFEFSTLEHRLRELAFLNSGVRIRLADERTAEGAVSEFYFDGGLLAFVDYLNRSRNSLHPTIIANSERDDIAVELALAWTDSFHEKSARRTTRSSSTRCAPTR